MQVRAKMKSCSLASTSSKAFARPRASSPSIYVILQLMVIAPAIVIFRTLHRHPLSRQHPDLAHLPPWRIRVPARTKCLVHLPTRTVE